MYPCEEEEVQKFAVCAIKIRTFTSYYELDIHCITGNITISLQKTQKLIKQLSRTTRVIQDLEK